MQHIAKEQLKSAKDGHFSRLFYSKVVQSLLLLIALVVILVLCAWEFRIVGAFAVMAPGLLAAGGRRAGGGQEYTTTRKGFREGLKAGLYQSTTGNSIAPASVVDTTTGRRFRVQYNDYRVILREEV